MAARAAAKVSPDTSRLVSDGRRIDVRKTYKLYIGGAFPRSESGHSYEVPGQQGEVRGQRRQGVAQGRARRGRRCPQGVPGLVGPHGVQPRTDPLPGRRGHGGPPAAVRAGGPAVRGRFDRLRTRGGRAGRQVDEAIDRLVWYAGWADKLGQVVGNANPVAGPFFNHSAPEPTGVVGVLAPQSSSLLGLVSVVAPVVVTGNTAVVVSSYSRPLPAVTFAEVLATSDVPGGVVNLLTGDAASLGPWLAAHMDVNAIDLTGLAGDVEATTALEVAAADNLKRVRRAPAAEPDWLAAPGLATMTDFVETKTVWHPIGV